MTWIFGSATPFIGTVLAVADIQVTVGSKRFDCLQKLYALDQNVLAGFAGDVEIGFGMLKAVHESIAANRRPPNQRARMRDLHADIPDRAIEVFGKSKKQNQKNGSAILISGASLNTKVMYGSEPSVARFRSPSFRCEVIGRGAWGSIGSGNQIDEYRQILEHHDDESIIEAVAMEENNPGGLAQVVFMSVMGDLENLPEVPGVSRHFHAGVATSHGYVFHTSDRTRFPAEGEPEATQMPPVARSWRQLKSLIAEQTGDSPTSAIASLSRW